MGDLEITPVQSQAITAMQKLMAEDSLIQLEQNEDLEAWGDQALNPLLQAARNRFTKLQEPKPELVEQEGENAIEDEAVQVLKIDTGEEAASRYEKRIDELQAKVLITIRGLIKRDDDVRAIIKKVQEFYKDAYLVDEALSFLEETTQLENVSLAKNLFADENKRAILSGKNIAGEVREFAQKGLASPTTLRELYHKITGEIKDALKLFDELSDQFPYGELNKVITFLLHSLGVELRSKGPSISHGELKKLIDDIRSLQGVIGIYRFFQSRMPLIRKGFQQEGFPFPLRISFDMISRQFVKLLSERYVNPERLLLIPKNLGLNVPAGALSVLFHNLKEAVRQIAGKFYRNPQQKEELLKAFIQLLTKLDEEAEEEEK